MPTDIKLRLESKIQELAIEPRPDGVAKLKNGDNRILYQILDDILIVTVVRVGHRSEVYRDE